MTTFFIYDGCGSAEILGTYQTETTDPAKAQAQANDVAEFFGPGAIARVANTACAVRCEECGCPSADAVCRRCRLGRQED